MQNATMFLAQERILEARQQAAEARLVRRSRHPRGPGNLLDRLWGDH